VTPPATDDLPLLGPPSPPLPIRLIFPPPPHKYRLNTSNAWDTSAIVSSSGMLVPPFPIRALLSQHPFSSHTPFRDSLVPPLFFSPPCCPLQTLSSWLRRLFFPNCIIGFEKCSSLIVSFSELALSPIVFFLILPFPLPFFVISPLWLIRLSTENE